MDTGVSYLFQPSRLAFVADILYLCSSYSPNLPEVAYVVSRHTAGGNPVVVSVVNGSLTLVDGGLQPYTLYTYSVVAVNRVGRSETALRQIVTPQGSPSGVSPPQLNHSTATSLTLTWGAPARENGFLQNYTVFVDGVSACTALSGGEAGEVFSCTVDQLTPFTE